MVQESFLSKNKIPLASIIICTLAFILLQINGGNNPYTGRFISNEPNIIHHGRILIYEERDNLKNEKTYSLMNYGETYLDALMSAKDNEASLRVYLPGIGWRELPKNESGTALCLINNMPPNSTLKGYEIEVNGSQSLNVLSLISFLADDSNKTRLCYKAGDYVSK